VSSINNTTAAATATTGRTLLYPTAGEQTAATAAIINKFEDRAALAAAIKAAIELKNANKSIIKLYVEHATKAIPVGPSSWLSSFNAAQAINTALAASAPGPSTVVSPVIPCPVTPPNTYCVSDITGIKPWLFNHEWSYVGKQVTPKFVTFTRKATDALANFIVDHSWTAFEEIQIQNHVVGAPHIAVHKSNTTGTLPGSFLISFYLGKTHLILLANNIVYIDPATGNRIKPAYHHENKIKDFFNNVRTTQLESTIEQQGKLHLYSIIFVNWYTAVNNGTNIVRFSVESITPAQIEDPSEYNLPVVKKGQVDFDFWVNKTHKEFQLKQPLSELDEEDYLVQINANFNQNNWHIDIVEEEIPDSASATVGQIACWITYHKQAVNREIISWRQNIDYLRALSEVSAFLVVTLYNKGQLYYQDSNKENKAPDLAKYACYYLHWRDFSEHRVRSTSPLIELVEAIQRYKTSKVQIKDFIKQEEDEPSLENLAKPEAKEGEIVEQAVESTLEYVEHNTIKRITQELNQLNPHRLPAQVSTNPRKPCVNFDLKYKVP
jgi:hypothetical protein